MNEIPNPPTPLESHRRKLARFARWFSALESFPAHRESVAVLARRIDMGGMGRDDTLAAIDALDGLLSEVWDRRPIEGNRCC